MSIKKKEVSLGIILSFLSVCANLIIGIIYTPILLSLLGQSEYGIYSLSTSFIGYLTIINAGANAAYIRFYVQSKENNAYNLDRINGIFAKIFVVLSIVAFAVGILITVNATVVFGDKITADEYVVAKKCLGILTVATVFEILTCFYSSLIIANENFIFGKGIVLFSSILKPIITIPFLLMGYDCSILLIIRLIVNVIVFFVSMIYCKRVFNFHIDWSSHEKVIVLNIFQFVFFIVLQSVFDQLNWQIDKFILARVRGSQAISIYSVGSTFNTYFVTIASAITSVFIAEVNRSVNDNNRLNQILYRTSKLLAYIVFFVMLAYVGYGDLFINIWAGSEYAESFIVGLLLMFPITFSLPLGLGQDIARAKNKHQLQIVFNLFICVVNVLVSIPLANTFGALGSALGTFLSEILICWVIQPIYYKKVLGLDVGGIYRQLFKVLPAMIPAGGYIIMSRALKFVSSNYISIFSNAIIAFIIWLICIYVFILSKNEREFILQKIRK